MDPIDLLQCLTSAMQFTDLGCIVVLGFNKLANGESHEEWQKHFELLIKQNDELTRTVGSELFLEHDNNLPEVQQAYKTIERCREAGAQLQADLKTVSTSASSGIVQQWTRPMFSTWREPKIRHWDYRIRELRSQLCECYQILSLKKSSVLHCIVEDMSRDVRGIRDQQDRILDMMSSEDRKNSPEVVDCIKAFTNGLRDGRKQRAVVESLDFLEIRDRESMIKDKHNFGIESQWAFKRHHADKPLYFHDWLRNGDGVYWVTGNPGCGKSTFMEYVANHRKTEQALRQWAGPDAQLVVAKAFFWSSGSPIQRSHEGLLRCLLKEIFCAVPSIIPFVIPHRWRDALSQGIDGPWTLLELKDALHRVTSEKIHNTRYCFFIDGLDEYQGQVNGGETGDQGYRELAESLGRLATHEGVKVCTSSRDWNYFGIEFGRRPAHRLNIQEHTSDDIGQFIRRSLKDDRAFEDNARTDAEFSRLIPHLKARADGVWLWVIYAMRDVREGLAHGEQLQELVERINNMRLLNDFLDDCLHKISDRYKQQAAQIFLMAFHANESIPLMALSVTGLLSIENRPGAHHVPCSFDSAGMSAEAFIPVYTRSEEDFRRCADEWDTSRISRAKLAVNARCQDFMEVAGNDDDVSIMSHCIRFKHRCCRDFFGHEQKYPELRRMAGQSFDPRKALVSLYGNSIKYVAQRLLHGKRDQEVLDALSRLLVSSLCSSVEAQDNASTLDTDVMEEFKCTTPEEQDDLSGTDTEDSDESERHSESDVSVDSAQESQISLDSDYGLQISLGTEPRTLSESFFDSCQDKVESQIQHKINRYQKHFIAKLHTHGLQQCTPKLPSPKDIQSTPRNELHSICYAMDPAGSLWQVLHVIPTLLILGFDVNQRRGRASVWRCWLQALVNIQARQKGSAISTRLLKTLQELTHLLLDYGGDPECTILLRGEAEDQNRTFKARAIIEQIFGHRATKKLLKETTWRPSRRRLMPRFHAVKLFFDNLYR